MKRILFFVFLFILASQASAYKYDVTDALGAPLGKFDDRLLNMYDQDWIGGGMSLRDYSWDRWVRDFRTDLLLQDRADGLKWELKMGRIYTLFTPLTLKQTLFAPNYAEDHQFGARWKISVDNSWFKDFTLLVNRMDLNDLTDINDPLVDTYFIAARVKTNPIGDLNLNFNFVHQYDDFRGIATGNDNFLTGSINKNNYPTEIYLKFLDNFPNDNNGGAALYGMKVYINGVYCPSLTFRGGSTIQEMGGNVSQINNNTTFYPDHLEANGPGFFILKLTLPGNGLDVKSVKFEFDIANNYKVIASPDNFATSYLIQTVLVCDVNEYQYRNRKIQTGSYAYVSGQTIMGVDAQFTLFGFDVSTEYEYNQRYSQYPNKNGLKDLLEGSAFFLKFDKNIDKLEFGADIFNMSKNYDCTFSVDDEDDANHIANATVIKLDDKNNNGIKDYNEDFLLFDAVDLGFRDAPDNNNNGIEDDVENDGLPDTPYYFGEHGFNCFLDYLFFNNFYNEIGYRLSNKVNGRKAEKYYHRAEFAFTKLDFIRPVIKNRLEYIDDNIPNNLVDYIDPLLFQDNLVDRFTFILNLNILKNMLVESKSLATVNVDDFSKGHIDSSRKDYEVIQATRLGYNYTPLRMPKLLLRFLYKNIYEHSYYTEQVAGTVDKTESLNDYLIFGIVYKFSDMTRIMGGYQKAYLRDYVFNYLTAQKDSLIFEISYSGKYWGKNLVVKSGVNYVLKEYAQNIQSNNKDSYSKVYLESYFNW